VSFIVQYNEWIIAIPKLLTPTPSRILDIAYSRVTVSTVGIVDKIRKLTEELPEVNLAVSLHAPTQELRTAIVPTANRYPIEDLVDALDNHMMTFLMKRKRMMENPQNGELVEFTQEERIKESTRRRAMIEYVMLEGPTSTMEAAHELGKLCEGRQLVVNLIPYNQTNVKDKLRCPSEEHMQSFRNVVTSYGAFCTIRRTMGADIDSACGQLVNMEQIRRRSTDLEDVVTAPANTPIPKAALLQPMKHGPNAPLDRSWLIKSLAVATAISATCFVASSVLYVSRRRR
jgi:adenine C2-methylase RlmN of 23S rRNA A2503 and tRNA A37